MNQEIAPDSPQGSQRSVAIETLTLLKAADGMLELGDAAEAFKTLHGVIGHTPRQRAMAASLRAQATSLLQGPEAGWPLMLEAASMERADVRLIVRAINEALNLGKPDEVIRLHTRFGALGGRTWPPHLHNVATAYMMLGKPDTALCYMYCTLVLHLGDEVWSALDPRLEPLWHHLADGLVICPDMEPLLSDLADKTSAERGLRQICWYTVHSLLPPEAVPWMKRSRDLMYFLDPSAPVSGQELLVTWLDHRRGRMARLLSRAASAVGEIGVSTHAQRVDLPAYEDLKERDETVSYAPDDEEDDI